MKQFFWVILMYFFLSCIVALVFLQYPKFEFVVFKYVLAINDQLTTSQFALSFTKYSEIQHRVRQFMLRKLVKEEGKKKYEKKRKDTIEEVCTEIRQPVENTCFNTAIVTKTFPCLETEQKEDCENVPVTIPKTCLKTFEEKVPYECVRKEYQNDCRPTLEAIEDVCTKLDVRKESYSCPILEYHTSCKEVPVQVVDICYKTVDKPFPYECKKEKIEKECKQIDIETESICEKTVMIKSPYDCSVTDYINDCSTEVPPVIDKFLPQFNSFPTGQLQMHMNPNHLDNNNGFPPFINNEYRHFQANDFESLNGRNNINFIPNGQGAFLMQRLRALGGKKKPKTDIAYIETGIVCKNMPIIVKKTCYYDEATVQSYPCIKKEMQTKCYPITISMPDTCYEMLPVQEAYECQKTEMKKDCQKIPVQIDKMCEREVPYERQFKCEVANYKTDCVPVPVEVPDTCFKGKPVTEFYPCPETVFQHVCKTVDQNVKKSCTKNEQIEVPYKCDKVEVKHHCYLAKQGHAVHGLKNLHDLTPVELVSPKAASAPLHINNGMIMKSKLMQVTPQGMLDENIIQMMQQEKFNVNNMQMMQQRSFNGNNMQKGQPGNFGRTSTPKTSQRHFNNSNMELILNGSFNQTMEMMPQNVLDKNNVPMQKRNFGSSDMQTMQSAYIEAATKENNYLNYMHSVYPNNTKNENYVQLISYDNSGNMKMQLVPQEHPFGPSMHMIPYVVEAESYVYITVPHDSSVMVHEIPLNYTDSSGNYIYNMPYTEGAFLTDYLVEAQKKMHNGKFTNSIIPPPYVGNNSMLIVESFRGYDHFGNEDSKENSERKSAGKNGGNDRNANGNGEGDERENGVI